MARYHYHRQPGEKTGCHQSADTVGSQFVSNTNILAYPLPAHHILPTTLLYTIRQAWQRKKVTVIKSFLLGFSFGKYDMDFISLISTALS
jgi:hypothetical protein